MHLISGIMSSLSGMLSGRCHVSPVYIGTPLLVKSLIALLAFVASPAWAADFSARVTQGNEVAATPEGRGYDASLAPAIQAALVACIPPGSSPVGAPGKFTLVGNVDVKGRLHGVEVRPSTAVSRCFADKFASAMLPSPPGIERQGGTYPVTVEMSITE